MMEKRLTNDRLSQLLLGSACLTCVASLVFLFRASAGFSESLLESASGVKAIAALVAALLLIAANFVYQLIIKLGIPFSRPMLLGFIAFEVFYSGFLFAWQV
ncbi:MAG: hypothetical protein NZM06_11585 [Chloroherpetonaceae bacterium]|nr:hypothetical protein [Chloroherpetonaceae bacterium]MDW8436953.1 hypothetical protein [Chloroherpetonaceae bacterium]